MSGCWPVVKAVLAVARKPVAHAVNHVVHHPVIGPHVVRRAVKAAVRQPPKPVIPSGECAKAPGSLPAGPGGYEAKAPAAAKPLLAGKTPAVVKAGGTVMLGLGGGAAAALFRAETEGGHLDGNGGDDINTGGLSDASSTGGTSGFGGPTGDGYSGGAGAPSFGQSGSFLPPAQTTQNQTGPTGQQQQPDAPGQLITPPDLSGFIPKIFDPVHKEQQPPGHVRLPSFSQAPDGTAVPDAAPQGTPELQTLDPQIQVANQQTTTVPEPASVLMFAVAATAVLLMRRMRRG